MTNREFDKWLAEKVMGWCVHEFTGKVKIDSSGDFQCTKCGEWATAHNLSDKRRIFIPTVSISDAFQVVEKMMENGYEFGMDADSSKWTTSFWPQTILSLSEADTAPLAICLAAKKAIEGA